MEDHKIFTTVPSYNILCKREISLMSKTPTLELIILLRAHTFKTLVKGEIRSRFNSIEKEKKIEQNSENLMKIEEKKIRKI